MMRIHPRQHWLTLTLMATLFAACVGVRAQSTLTAAREAMRSGLLDEAHRLLATALAANPKNVEALNLAGVLATQLHRPDQAQAYFDKALALAPSLAATHINMGNLLLTLGSFDQAASQFQIVLAQQPGNTAALIAMASLDLDQGRALDAADLLVRANRLAPNQPDTLLLMARVSMSQRFYEDAIPLLERASALAPTRVDLLMALGECFFKSDKIEQSLRQFERVVALSPSAQAYADIGLADTYLGRFADARQQFEKGLQLDPHNTFCLFHLGYLAEKQGDNVAAESTFRKVLAEDASFPYALLELANLDLEARRFDEAAELLRKYVTLASAPAAGYYKLAMAERGLHHKEAADKALATFQQLSKAETSAAYPYENIYDSLDKRAALAPEQKRQLDLEQLVAQAQAHPDQPQLQYALAEAYFNAGRLADATSTLDALDRITADDPRMQAGIGSLLARFHQYAGAVAHYRTALVLTPDSDAIKHDLASALLAEGSAYDAEQTCATLSAAASNTLDTIDLKAAIAAALGHMDEAEALYRQALVKNPDNDQDALLLALAQLKTGQLLEARATLDKAQARLPASGRIAWGAGLVAALDGNNPIATEDLERAVSLAPEWVGSYATLGVFYFQTGQVDKAREMLDRFRSSNTGGLDIARIQNALAGATTDSSRANEPLSSAARMQLLQFALTVAARTL